MAELVYSYRRDREMTALLSSCMVTAPGARRRAKNLPDPGSFEMIAQWDTGASNCAISRGIVEYLGIKPIGGKINVKGVNGTFESDIYAVDILLPNGIVFENVRVTEMKKEDVPLIIIGLNIIARSDFRLEPKGDKTIMKFRYPPEGDKPFTTEPTPLFQEE